MEVAKESKRDWSIIDLIKWGEGYFNKNNFDSPKQEIEWLLCDLLDYKRVDLYLNFEEIVPKNKLSTLNKWVKKRIKRMPLQYITGSTEFYGNKFFLNENVLIPRQETERLVDICLKSINKLSAPKILEIGTGSGCISISIALIRSDAKILSIDISQNALKKAIINSDYHQTRNISFVELDFLKELPKGHFDIIISNPPYISSGEMKNIMTDVKDYEPEIALTDFMDGLQFYERLSIVAPKLLNQEGSLILEVGSKDHPDKVLKLFKSKGYNKIELFPDYNNDQRVLKVRI
ncbi:MAG: peptide chain release factor N(5)-glutamine methyltransferase [Candidatus Neomarinimicrobiota bacterium]|nr:protein-(glutamine-N5) methyltransferase, release factor-specific [Candidatus Neomarinimicrobiota bacterium]MED5433980.1 peptide chain release factor N(5)-glutamine methyltransferase [Candidatus Neomarinimicrobiota bacterium]